MTGRQDAGVAAAWKAALRKRLSFARILRGFTTEAQRTQRRTENLFKSKTSVPLCVLCASVVNPHTPRAWRARIHHRGTETQRGSAALRETQC